MDHDPKWVRKLKLETRKAHGVGSEKWFNRFNRFNPVVESLIFPCSNGGFLKWGSPSWMVYFMENPNIKWMIPSGKLT